MQVNRGGVREGWLPASCGHGSRQPAQQSTTGTKPMPAYSIQFSSQPPDAQVKATAYGLSVAQVVWGGGARSDPRGGRGSKGHWGVTPARGERGLVTWATRDGSSDLVRAAASHSVRASADNSAHHSRKKGATSHSIIDRSRASRARLD